MAAAWLLPTHDRFMAGPIFFLFSFILGILGIASWLRLRSRNRTALTALAVSALFALTGAFAPTTCTCDARSEICAANLRALYGQLSLYAANHGDQCPESLDDVLAGDPQFSPATLKCPSVDKGKSPAESYVYLGAGRHLSDDPNTVLIYEPVARHDGQAAVLFANGGVEFKPLPFISALPVSKPRPATSPTSRP
jgi:hypothetical protein